MCSATPAEREDQVAPRLKIAYGKLGRSLPLREEGISSSGGDVEVLRLLHMLRERYEVHLVGRNSADATLEHVVNHWAPGGLLHGLPFVLEDEVYPDHPKYLAQLEHLRRASAQLPRFDAWIIWIGSHGATSSFMPRVRPEKAGTDPRLKGLTRPLMSLVNYVGPLVHLTNWADARPIWLCPDPRNELKLRDVGYPDQRPILSQYNQTRLREFWHEKHGFRHGTLRYQYAGLELLAVPPAESRKLSDPSFPPPELFGVLANEGPTDLGDQGRLHMLKKLRNHVPDFELLGHWSMASQRTLDRRVTPVAQGQVAATLARWRGTVTFPASGSGWATAKPWECMRAGCVCFKWPGYDNQQHIYGDMPLDLHKFVAPATLSTLFENIHRLEDPNLWRQVSGLQTSYLQSKLDELAEGARHVYSAVEDEASKRSKEYDDAGNGTG